MQAAAGVRRRGRLPASSLGTPPLCLAPAPPCMAHEWGLLVIIQNAHPWRLPGPGSAPAGAASSSRRRPCTYLQMHQQRTPAPHRQYSRMQPTSSTHACKRTGSSPACNIHNWLLSPATHWQCSRLQHNTLAALTPATHWQRSHLQRKCSACACTSSAITPATRARTEAYEQHSRLQHTGSAHARISCAH